jgi:hypothetical protein
MVQQQLHRQQIQWQPFVPGQNIRVRALQQAPPSEHMYDGPSRNFSERMVFPSLKTAADLDAPVLQVSNEATPYVSECAG